MSVEMPWWAKLLRDFVAGAMTKDALGNAPGAQASIIELGSGYTAPQPPVGVLESRALEHCEPELQGRFLAVKRDFEAQTGRQIFLTCTWRSKERQMALYAQGRTAPGKIVTKIDGVTRRSRHMTWPSQAVDVCVDTDPGPGKHPVWDEASYAPLGPLCAQYGLIWGGSWSGFRDLPHIELPPC